MLCKPDDSVSSEEEDVLEKYRKWMPTVFYGFSSGDSSEWFGATVAFRPKTQHSHTGTEDKSGTLLLSRVDSKGSLVEGWQELDMLEVPTHAAV